MNRTWTIKRLAEVCVLQRGFDLPKKDRRPGKFPLLSSSGAIDAHAEAKVHGPGVVTGRSGSIGQVFYVREDFWPLNTSLYVKDFHGNDPRFVAYLLESFDLKKFASGTGVPTLNRNHVHDERVFVPTDIAEQKRIVAILDQAFADIDKARALTEQNLKNARELFESTLQQVFSQRGEGWTEKPIAELGMVQTGSTPKTSDKANFGDHIAFVKPGHFSDDGSIVLDDVGLSEKGREQSRVIPENSVLMVCIGATIGKCGHVNQAVTCNQQINALTPTSELHHRFAYYQMLTPSFQREVIKLSGQATLPIINKKKWSSLKVVFPSYPLQVEFVEKLDSIKRRTAELELIYRSKLTGLADLKHSLLQKAFSGELTKTAAEAAA